MGEKVGKVALVGAGAMAECHVCGYHEAGAEVVAIVDRNPEAGRKFAEKCQLGKIPVVETLGELQRTAPEVQAVSVITPNKFHRPLVLEALERGLHVFCEKPPALNAAETKEMADKAKEKKLRLMFNLNNRARLDSQFVKRQIRIGRIGTVNSAQATWMRRTGIPGFGGWFTTKAISGGGPLIDLGVHRLDLALWLMGYPEPAWVMGSTYCKIAGKLAAERGLDYTVEDLACAMIKFKNGATLELDAAWASNIKENEQMSTRILGDKGGLYQYNLNEGYTWDAEYYQDMEGRQFDSKLHSSPEVRNAFWLFADAVRDDTPFLVQPEEGVVVMRLLDAIYESARTGEPVKF